MVRSIRTTALGLAAASALIPSTALADGVTDLPDTTPPAITGDGGPPASGWWNGSSASICYYTTGKDSGSGTTQLSLVKDGRTVLATITAPGVARLAGFLCTTVAQLGQGMPNLTVVGSDAAGNTASRPVQNPGGVDTQAPAFSIQTADGLGTTTLRQATFSVTLTSGPSGLSTWTVKLDGGQPLTLVRTSATTWVATLSAATLAAGGHTFSWSAISVAGVASSGYANLVVSPV